MQGEAGVWIGGLRDADTAVWSRPTAQSKDLDAAYAALHGGSGRPFPADGADGPPSGSSRGSSPKLKRTVSMKAPGAVEAEGDLRAVSLCQKPSALRTHEDIKFIQSYMCALSHFFSLWPAPLQWELARLLSAHILARREVALTRGRSPDRVYFVVQGRLDVRLPVPSPGGGREERTLAVLTRGHTVGEAILLGAQVQHTTVVVSSSSAILLSLSRPDFSRAFKEVLDIRQAERLMYLRLHPLMAGAGLELHDLEAAAEVLGLAFFPPGTRLWPVDEKDRCLYFLAEGQAKVKRPGGPGAAVHNHDQADGTVVAAPSMYDRFTVSMLGPGDIFGLPSTEQALTLQVQQACATAPDASQPHSPPGTAALGATANSAAAQALAFGVGGNPHTAASTSAAGSAQPGAATGLGAGLPLLAAHGAGSSGASIIIEAYSQVKVYYVKYADYARLPAAVQRVLQAANSFRWSYYEGRIVGLAKMDTRRRDVQREQLLRKKKTVALQRRGAGLDGPLHSVAAAAALELAERDKVLLAPVSLLGPAVAAANFNDSSMPEQQGASARRKAQAEQERTRLRDTASRQPQASAAGSGNSGSAGGDLGLPAWALVPATGGGRSGTETGLTLGHFSDTQPAPERPGTAGSGAELHVSQGQPASTDSAAASTSTVAVAGHTAGASNTRGLNPLLHRNKALMAVQAQQLSRVLLAEKGHYAQRQPLLHPYNDEHDASSDYRAPWAIWDSSSSNSHPDSEPHAGARSGDAPWTAQFLTCRAEPLPKRELRVPVVPTLGLLSPSVTTFPRVQSHRHERDMTVVTEQPRSISVPQTIRQRHVLMFQNAQAMAAQASNSRPWLKQGRAQRPVYSRSTHTSQAFTASAPSSQSAHDAAVPVDAQRAGMPPLPGSRFGADGAVLTSSRARTSSGGRPQRPDDRLSRYGSTGRSSSASGGRASASGGGPSGAGSAGEGLSSDLPSPKPGFGRAAAAGGELSFAHLGIGDDGDGGSDEEDLIYSAESADSADPVSLTEEQRTEKAGPASASPGVRHAAPGAEAPGAKTATASRGLQTSGATRGASPGAPDLQSPSPGSSGGSASTVLNTTLRRSRGLVPPVAAPPAEKMASSSGPPVSSAALPSGAVGMHADSRAAVRGLPSSRTHQPNAEFPTDLVASSIHQHSHHHRSEAPLEAAPLVPAEPPPSQQPAGLPPGIALGYLSLDPWSWAAMATQIGPNIRTPFTQDSVLPRPSW